MSTRTIPPQPTELTLPSRATREDAMLLLQLAQLAAQTDVTAAVTVLDETAEPYSYRHFLVQHRIGSPSYIKVLHLLQWFETVGTLVKHGLLDRDLVYDWLSVAGTWSRVAGIAAGMREQRHDPRLWENFEALATGQPGAATPAG